MQEIEYDSMNNPINFINKYLVLPADLNSTDTLSIQLDEDQLDEGYYKLSAKVALVSQYPYLIDLEGENPIVQVGPGWICTWQLLQVAAAITLCSNILLHRVAGKLHSQHSESPATTMETFGWF